MHEKTMKNDEALRLCIKTFDGGVAVNLPNGRFFPPANMHERDAKRKEMMKKILDYGKEYVVVQNDNRGLVLEYLN